MQTAQKTNSEQTFAQIPKMDKQMLEKQVETLTSNLYLDFEKAFVTVPHGKLLANISAHGMGGKLPGGKVFNKLPQTGSSSHRNL